MSKTITVYKTGNYAAIFGMVRKKQVVTRSQVEEFCRKNLKNGKGKPMTEKQAAASTGVILSPRESSERGDCRGNISAQGHLYFMEPLKKVKAGDELRFRLRYRKTALEPLRREVKADKVDSKKSRKAGAPAKRKTTTKAKAKVEATA